MERQEQVPVLEIKDLEVVYKTKKKVVQSVNSVNLTLNKGKVLGLVGETGAGKTTTALGIMRLLPERTSQVLKGEILFKGEAMMKKTEKDMLKIRGNHMAMIFQDPMTSLNPVMTVGDQIKEALYLHRDLAYDALEGKAVEILELVGISSERINEYPHQFSGGMKQRVIIAMALACEPDLLIADEPTTALDVTIQAQVLAMMKDLKKKMDMSMLLITHDLGVVAQNCDDVAIMYAGEILESGTVSDIFNGQVHHPYTQGLFNSIPDISQKSQRLQSIEGLMPDPSDLPSGCKFHPRCTVKKAICSQVMPEAITNEGHMIRCHLLSKEKRL